jgi:hypothetical protein
MTIRRGNPREQGAIGLGAAISWFLSQGYHVSVPVAEIQRYDLVVGDDDGLKRVEVKTTTHKKRGKYVVVIRTCGGNQSWNGIVKKFDPDEVELLFVLTDDGSQYVIPTEHVQARTMLTLGPQVERFRVNSPQMRFAFPDGE